MSTLICLGGGIEGLPILQRAKALGHRLVVVDGNPNAPGFAIADLCAVASCYDVTATVRELDIIAAPYDGVLCCAIDAPDVAAAVKAAYGLPGLPPPQAALSADKLAQKRCLRAAGLPVPDFREFLFNAGPYYDAEQFVNRPTIVKPVDSRGARGVSLVGVGEDIYPPYERARAATPSGRTMIEEYIPGVQLSTESIVQNGKVLFTMIGERNYSRFAAGQFGPHPVEDGFDAPVYHDALASRIDSLLILACRALGWDNLTVKGDWIVGEDGQLYILELAARLSGGFFASHGAPLAYGVDLVGAAINLALGMRAGWVTVSNKKQYVSQRYVFPDAGDVGRRVASTPFAVKYQIGDVVQCGIAKDPPRLANGDLHLSQTKWLAGVQHISQSIRRGDTIRAVTDHGARWGQVMCVGATAEEARSRAEAAVEVMQKGVVLE